MELHLPGDQEFLGVDGTWGGVAPLAIQREMIRRTIKEHLDKETDTFNRSSKPLLNHPTQSNLGWWSGW